MSQLTIQNIIGLAIVLPLYLVPLARIFSRAGWNGWMALLFPIPIVGMMLLWVFAFRPWPALSQHSIRTLPDHRT
jgi:hypothetical protein